MIIWISFYFLVLILCNLLNNANMEVDMLICIKMVMCRKQKIFLRKLELRPIFN